MPLALDRKHAAFNEYSWMLKVHNWAEPDIPAIGTAKPSRVS